MKRGEGPYRNHSAAPREERVRVPAPRPVFSGAAEVHAFQGAVKDTAREDGESLVDWLARVAARAEESLGESGS